MDRTAKKTATGRRGNSKTITGARRRRKPKATAAIVQIAPPPERPWLLTPDEITIVKNSIAKGASDMELNFCLTVARRYKLDPFKQQIWFVKRWDKEADNGAGGKGAHVWTPQVGINGLLFAAARDHKADFGSVSVPQYGPFVNGAPEWAKVKVWKKGELEPTEAQAWWDEYAPSDLSKAPFWRKMPRRMIAKCATALAIRQAYPDLGGLYIPEECERMSEDYTPEGRQLQPDPKDEIVKKRLAEHKDKAVASVETKGDAREEESNPHLQDFKQREKEQLERIEREKQEKTKVDAAAAKEAAAKAHPASTPKPEASKPASASAKPGPGIPPSVVPPAGLGILKSFEVRTGTRGKFGVIWLEGNKLPLFIFDNKELPISSAKTARTFDMLAAPITKGFKCGFVIKGRTHPAKVEGDPPVLSYEAIETTQIGPLEWDRGVQVIRTDREPGKQQAMFEREPGE